VVLEGRRGFVPWSQNLKDKESLLDEDLQVRVLPVGSAVN
jgi:hypothetical protein